MQWPKHCNQLRLPSASIFFFSFAGDSYMHSVQGVLSSLFCNSAWNHKANLKRLMKAVGNLFPP